VFAVFRLRRALTLVDGKAEQLGAKRLLNMLCIGRIEFVLFFEPPLRPLGSRVLTADVIQFGEHHVAETG
jgi:hypothetical protein